MAANLPPFSFDPPQALTSTHSEGLLYESKIERENRNMPKEASGETPQALHAIAEDPRILVRRGGPPVEDARCVVYWMQRAQRGIDNPALDVAIDVGNELNLPVVAFFSAIANYPHANLRHYAFLNQGLADIEEDLKERGVGF